METRDFDFELPEDLVALEPAATRDHSRLLVLRRGGLEDRCFYDLPSFLNEGDLLLLNNTKVLPVRFVGKKPTGGELDVLLVRKLAPGRWKGLWKSRYTGPLEVSERLSLELREDKEVQVLSDKSDTDIAGLMPLPPYIKRKPHEGDRERYQTVYAEKGFSIAAPTAGLHFTEELLEKIDRKGVLIRKITLNVGKGTFIPVKAARIEEHRMEEEEFEFSEGILSDMKRVKARGGKIFAVGTTTVRAIEGYLSGKAKNIHLNGLIKGSTDIFISPGYRFKAIDCLITNFHLPRSTPLMLASALAGRENLLRAYAHAVSSLYRFFSYGDAMLISDKSVSGKDF